MNAAVEALERVEAEVAQLLAAGLGTRRAGRDRLEALADDVARLRLERLAVELRSLATTDDPTTAAGAAMGCLTLARKLRERLDPWPEVDLASGTAIVLDPSIKLVGNEPSPQPSPRGRGGEDASPREVGASPHPNPLPEGEEIPPSPAGKGDRGLGLLFDRFLSGDSLARADAARQLVALGDASIPALSRLAERGTLTIKREVIACLGQIGTEAALRALVGCLATEDAQRALLFAARAFGERAVPELIGVLERDVKKKVSSRSTAAWLLYRLGADAALRRYSEDQQQVVAGFALSARARSTGAWETMAAEVMRPRALGELTRDLFAVLQAEASGEVGPIVEALDQRTANRVEAVAGYLVGTPHEAALGEHYLAELRRGTAKDRNRAEALLAGLADLALVPRLAAAYERSEVEATPLSNILGRVGGDQAVGLLLDMTRAWPEIAAVQLGHIGEPSTAPRLFDLAQDGSTMYVQGERALVGLSDSAVDHLAGELRGDGARALRAQRILLQIKELKKSERAARALAGTDPESLPLLLSYLGHPMLAKSAIEKLAGRGEAVLDALSDVVYHGAHPARLDAIAAIAAVKTPRASAIVHDVVEGIVGGGSPGSDAHVAARGIALLPTIRNERTIPLVARAIGVVAKLHPAAAAATEALPKLGREAVPYMLPYLSHTNELVKVLSLRVLGELAAPEAEPRAIELLADPSFAVSNAATEALGKIGRANGSVAILDALVAAAVSPRNFWPGNQIAALGATHNPAAIPRLRAIAKAYRDRRSPVVQNVETLVAQEVQRIEKAAAKAAGKAETRTPGTLAAPEAQSAVKPEGGLLGSVRRLFGGR